MRATRARARRIALLAGLVLACAAPTPTAKPTPRTGPPEHLVLAPLNVAVPMPKELHEESFGVARRLRIHLETHGRTVTALPPSQGFPIWRESIAEVEAGGGGGFEQAARIFARRVASESGADSVVLPSLVIRRARQRHGHARWDGTVRGVDGPMRDIGELTGVSLHVFVYSAAGERLYDAYGGIEITHRWDEDEGDLAVRDDLLEDTDPVREGIATALDPYLGGDS